MNAVVVTLVFITALSLVMLGLSRLTISDQKQEVRDLIYQVQNLENEYKQSIDKIRNRLLKEYKIMEDIDTLGKQENEPKSMRLSDVKQKIDEWMDSHTEEEVYELLKKHGAVEDADTVIQGWVCRDEDGDVPVFVGEDKPYKKNGCDFWCVKYGRAIEFLRNTSFPDLTWDDNPIEVEIIIKRKKNG